MLHSLFRVHRRQLSSVPSSRLSRRVHPPISQPTTSISQCSRRTHIKMSDSEDGVSFVLDEYNNVPVATKDLPKDPVKTLTKDELKEWAPFKTWISTLTASLARQAHPSHPDHNDPYQLHDITIDSYTRFESKRIGFLKLTANVSKSTTTNVTLPGTIFLRGPSVAMLVVLRPDDHTADEEAHVLLTVQPRIATGSLAFVELPAGMMDADSNFAGKAAQEIREELGLVIHEDDLVCLTDQVAAIRQAKKRAAGPAVPAHGNEEEDDEEKEETRLPFAMYPSAGGCDEYIKIFAHERRVPRAQLREWQGRLTGLRDAGEMITLKVVPLEDLWLEGGMDSKALAAWTMYTQLKQWEKEQDEK